MNNQKQVYGCTKNPPPEGSLLNKHPMAHSGECVLNGPPVRHDIYNPGVPNPVMTEYHHRHHPKPPRPDDDKFVTKKELNEILRNIAKATLFEDNTADGTTCSVGGIAKGTKFSNKLSFTEFIQQLLYSKELESDDDYIYPCKDKDGSIILNHVVTNPIGGFVEGDSLEGMYISEIIEKLLCGGSNMWGKYIWKSELYDLPSGELEIDANKLCPKLLEDMNSDKEGIIHWYQNTIMKGMYSLYAVVHSEDKEDVSLYKYDCLIACSLTEDSENPQVTNPTWEDVPENLSWSFDYEANKIILSGSGITSNMSLVMISRSID
jgi:hypothetical protein